MRELKSLSSVYILKVFLEISLKIFFFLRIKVISVPEIVSYAFEIPAQEEKTVEIQA